jgi:hypothetical protein
MEAVALKEYEILLQGIMERCELASLEPTREHRHDIEPHHIVQGY